MKPIKILFIALTFALLLLPAGSVQAQVITPGEIKPAAPTKGRDSGRSNTDLCCPNRWAYIPPQGDGRQISPEGEAGLLFGDTAPAPTVEVTVYNDKNRVQDPKSWTLKTVNDRLVVDLSRLRRGAYRVVFRAGEVVKEGWVR